MEIKFIVSDQVSLVREFYQNQAELNLAASRREEYFLWKYARGPYVEAFSGGLTILGAFEEDELIGTVGFMALRLNAFGQKKWGCHITDWVSRQDARPKAVGLSLIMSLIRDKRFSAFFAMDTTENSLEFYRRMHWSISELMPRYLQVINGRHVSEYVRAYPDLYDFIKNWPANGFKKSASGVRVQEISSLEAVDWDAFYWNVPAKKHWGVARDKAFLHWRYVECPLLRYRMLYASDEDGPQGLLIFRDETSSDKQLRLARITELIGTEQGIEVVLDRFLDLVLDENFDLADYFAQGKVFWKSAEKKGFRSVTGPDGYRFPYLFQPFNGERTQVKMAWHFRESLETTNSDLADEMTYITKGDGDFDRPV